MAGDTDTNTVRVARVTVRGPCASWFVADLVALALGALGIIRKH
jgi:hypothetical protein